MPPPTTRRTIPKPRRTLLIFLAFVLGLAGLLVGLDLSAKPGADSVWTPKLGLDLEGGTRITLQAKNDRGKTPDPEKLQEARSIIDQRVNATGVSEAERLDAVKYALELTGNINAKAHLGDYPMTGTLESNLAHFPDNFEDIANLGVGDPRFDGMTALHAAVLCNQPEILKFMIAQGADVFATNRLGWTPLTISKGIFLANSKKEFPAAAAILEKAMAEKKSK